MVKPARLVRATSRVMPSLAPSCARSAWAVASDSGLRPVRPLGRSQGEVTTREIASIMVCRLSGDNKPEIATFAGYLGRLRCVRPYAVADDSSPFAAVSGVPDGWRQTAALEEGHDFIALIEALVADGLAGRMAEGEHWLQYLELRFRRPALMAELRFSDAGRDILDGGGHLAAAIAPLAGLRACYCAAPPSLPATLNEALKAARQSVPEPSRIEITRTLDVAAIVDLLEEMRNG